MESLDSAHCVSQHRLSLMRNADRKTIARKFRFLGAISGFLLEEFLFGHPPVSTFELYHYPPSVKKYFPEATHQTFKGRRGCVVGQGELKVGGL